MIYRMPSRQLPTLAEMAPPRTPVKKPPKWSKRVAAAYLRMIGLTQGESAKGVGISRRTMQRWEQDSSWPAAMDEARDLWMRDVDVAARARILRAIHEEKANDLARWFLEHTDRRFQPQDPNRGLHMNVIIGAKLGIARSRDDAQVEP